MSLFLSGLVLGLYDIFLLFYFSLYTKAKSIVVMFGCHCCDWNQLFTWRECVAWSYAKVFS